MKVPTTDIAGPSGTRFRYITGDCFSYLKSMGSETVDALWTDPPYFLSSRKLGFSNGRIAPTYKGSWDEPRSPSEVQTFHNAWIIHAARILKPGRSLWVTTTHHSLQALLQAIELADLALRQVLVWQKTDPPPTVSPHHFPFETEFLLWATKGPVDATRTPSALRKSGTSWAESSVWKLPAALPSEKAHGRHPTQKPVTLVKRCILAATQAGDTVVDPFAGSGTTAVACLELGRSCICIENDADFTWIAIRRLNAKLSEITP